jgi:hypothetical protein
MVSLNNITKHFFVTRFAKPLHPLSILILCTAYRPHAITSHPTANIWDLERIWSKLGDRTESGRKVWGAAVSFGRYLFTTQHVQGFISPVAILSCLFDMIIDCGLTKSIW